MQQANPKGLGCTERHTGHPLEEPGESEEANDDHHPEQHAYRSIVDGVGADGLVEGKHPRDQHQDCPDQGDACSVNAQAGNFAQGEAEVGQYEENAGQPECRFTIHSLFGFVF